LQADPTGRELRRVHRRDGRGLAQLPSRFPVGLQGGRDRRVPAEHDHHVAGPVRQNRMGVRPEVAVQAARPAGGRQPRRRELARSPGRGGVVAGWRQVFVNRIRSSPPRVLNA